MLYIIRDTMCHLVGYEDTTHEPESVPGIFNPEAGSEPEREPGSEPGSEAGSKPGNGPKDKEVSLKYQTFMVDS